MFGSALFIPCLYNHLPILKYIGCKSSFLLITNNTLGFATCVLLTFKSFRHCHFSVRQWDFQSQDAMDWVSKFSVLQPFHSVQQLLIHLMSLDIV